MIMITRSESTTLNLVLTWVPDGTPVYSVATTESLRAAGYTPAAEVADVVLQRDEAQREVARLTARIEATDAMLAAEQESPTRGEDSRACSRCGGSGSRNGCRCTQCFGTGRATNKNSSGPAGSSAEEEPNPTPSACSEGLATPDNPSGRPVGNVAKPECEPEGTPPHAPAGPGEASQTSDGPAMLAEKPSAWLARYSTTHPCCTIVDAIGAWLNHAFPRGAASRSDGQEDFPQCQAEYPGVRGGSWACVLGHGHAGEHRDTRGLWAEPKGEPVMTRANNVGMGDARVNGGVLDEAESAARHYAARGMLVAQPDEQAAQPKGEPNDTGVIRADEGVSLEPGEYEVVEIAARDDAPDHHVGQVVALPGRVSSVDRDGHVFVFESVDSWSYITAVRRVEQAAQSGQRGEAAEAQCAKFCSCAVCMPWWPRRSADVAREALAKVSELERAAKERIRGLEDQLEMLGGELQSTEDIAHAELAMVRASLEAVEKERDDLLGQAHFDELARADAEERATALVSQLSARDAELAAEKRAGIYWHGNIMALSRIVRRAMMSHQWEKLVDAMPYLCDTTPPVEPAPEVVREIRVGSTGSVCDLGRHNGERAEVFAVDAFGNVGVTLASGNRLALQSSEFAIDSPQELPPPSGDK